jgi:hypothetical protein
MKFKCINTAIHVTIIHGKGFVTIFFCCTCEAVVQPVHSLISLFMGLGLFQGFLMLLTVLLIFVPKCECFINFFKEYGKILLYIYMDKFNFSNKF